MLEAEPDICSQVDIFSRVALGFTVGDAGFTLCSETLLVPDKSLDSLQQQDHEERTENVQKVSFFNYLSSYLLNQLLGNCSLQSGWG